MLLGALGTGLAYIWNIGVLRAWGPTNVVHRHLRHPRGRVVLGIMVLGETLSWNEPAGAVLILIGILFAQERIPWRRKPGTAAPVAEQDAVLPLSDRVAAGSRRAGRTRHSEGADRPGA